MRMEADVWPHGTRGAKGESTPPRARRRIRWRWVLLGVVVLFVVTRVIAVIVTAEDEPPPVTDNSEEVRREYIINAVTDGHLPPVALRIYPWSGRVDPNFIDGPNYGKDIVHVRGAEGPKLQWDLDGDGKIARDERTITEQELYVATMRWRYKRP
jgi:hypothetical protein